MADAVTPLFLHARNGRTFNMPAESYTPAAPPSPTFRQAAESYVQHAGGKNRYLPAVVEYFGSTPVAQITPFDIKQMALALYPDVKGQTRNRHALTPARSVILHAYERGWCGLMCMRKFKEEPAKRKNPASQAWLHIFCRQCEKDAIPHVAGIVLFMAQTGARVSEAVNLRWRDVDLPNRKALLVKTKTDTNSTRFLTDELVERMRALSAGQEPDDHVFRYTSRYSVAERMRAVCERAGIEYKSPHTAGRHSFASNAMRMGLDIRTTMEAGGWKSSAVFLEVYVHVKDAGRMVADRFNSQDYNPNL